MVVCLERGADLHMAQLMPLPLTVSCFSKIQIGFTFLVPAHLGSPGQLEDFVSAKFYCPHALADSNQRIRIREKTLEFSTVLYTLSVLSMKLSPIMQYLIFDTGDSVAVNALTLLFGCQEEHPAH